MGTKTRKRRRFRDMLQNRSFVSDAILKVIPAPVEGQTQEEMLNSVSLADIEEHVVKTVAVALEKQIKDALLSGEVVVIDDGFMMEAFTSKTVENGKQVTKVRMLPTDNFKRQLNTN